MRLFGDTGLTLKRCLIFSHRRLSLFIPEVGVGKDEKSSGLQTSRAPNEPLELLVIIKATVKRPSPVRSLPPPKTAIKFEI